MQSSLFFFNSRILLGRPLAEVTEALVVVATLVSTESAVAFTLFSSQTKPVVYDVDNMEHFTLNLYEASVVCTLFILTVIVRREPLIEVLMVKRALAEFLYASLAQIRSLLVTEADVDRK